jgi:hypothetical protein
VALLFIILALLGFVFAGVGSGSTSMSDAPIVPQPKPVVKCSSRMQAEPQKQQRCFPPANP